MGERRAAIAWTVIVEFTDKSIVKKTDVKFYEIQKAIFELRNTYSDRPAIERITVR